jgi:hypothetical protein
MHLTTLYILLTAVATLAVPIPTPFLEVRNPDVMTAAVSVREVATTVKLAMRV